MIDISSLKDIILLLSIIINVLLTKPYGYLRKRYEGAQKRRMDFYKPLIEDIRNARKDLEEMVHLRIRGLEEVHLSLLLSNKTKLHLTRLMMLLDDFNRALHDLEFYIYPEVVDKVRDEIGEVEREFFTALSIPRSSETSEFILRLERSDAYRCFLIAGMMDREINLSSFPLFVDMLERLERAHVNHRLKKILDHMLTHISSTYVFKELITLRKNILELLERIQQELEKESYKLSSRFYGAIYGAGEIELINDYKEKREKEAHQFTLK